MPLTNYERMLQMAEAVFDARHDPEQLDVDMDVLERFARIHPATRGEYKDENGPIAWVLLLPTTQELMRQFLDRQISEKDLFDRTPLDVPYDALYLCSAMVLEEYRQKGITKKLVLEALEKIRHDHPVQCLFVWSFSREGDLAAEALAKHTGLPLYKR